MDLFTQLFGNFIAFVYHCFDRIVISGYLTALYRPEGVANFFHMVVGIPVISKERASEPPTIRPGSKPSHVIITSRSSGRKRASAKKTTFCRSNAAW